jgi:hypothetical protein
MAISTIFKYLGLAIEAANQAADIKRKISEVKDPDSPGGKEITEEEMKKLLNDVEDNCSEVITRICQEVGLPIAGVTVDIETT